MSNEVYVYSESYYIQRYGDDEPAITISKDQYAGLEKVLLDTNVKFVKIGDKIISAGSIKEVGKVATKQNALPPEPTPEERKKALEMLDEVRSELKDKNVI